MPLSAAKIRRSKRQNEKSFVVYYNDPYRIERPDISVNNNTIENRWQTIGRVNNIIFVVYEERVGEEVRLISARLATARERRIYNGYKNDDIEPWGSAY